MSRRVSGRSLSPFSGPTRSSRHSRILHNESSYSCRPGTFSQDELSFVKSLHNEIEIECPICFHVMLNDPHQTSCCGHHFCSPCISRVKGNNGTCPVCKKKNYQIFPDKNRLRIIRGLCVYCTNKDSGCEWSGELKDLADHINKGKRDGKCQYEEVKCRYTSRHVLQTSCSQNCTKRDKRHLLDKHEKEECPCRPYTCQYCQNYEAKYWEVTDEHYTVCPKYPVPCTNSCVDGNLFKRDTLQYHFDQECPLQPVECQFKWAGCNETPLRKDLQGHIDDKMNNHLSLLAQKMKKENEKLKKDYKELKRDNRELKKDIEELKEENKRLRRDNRSGSRYSRRSSRDLLRSSSRYLLRSSSRDSRRSSRDWGDYIPSYRRDITSDDNGSYANSYTYSDIYDSDI